MPTESPAGGPDTLSDVDVESSMRAGDGVQLHTVAAGDPDDPLVVLLHGFPECWYGWHRQLPGLVDAGYRVLVPDQRGYNRSDKPPLVHDYTIDRLSADVEALIASEDRESAHVVGHDWGAAVAWDFARRHPDAVDRLGILNVPHPSVMRRALTRSPRQLLRSWYAFFFQLPGIPEWVSAVDDFRFLRAILDSTRPGTFTPQQVEAYVDAWGHDGALTGMLNWYRAFARHGDGLDTDTVDAPTLIIWGEDDVALVPELAPRSLEHCTNGRLERFADAGHFVQHEKPEHVTRLLVDHLDAA